VVIIETSVFTRQILRLLPDDEYRELQTALVLRPDLGSPIPGGGGIRKVRWGLGHHGKRGGLRAIYYWYVRKEQIFMLLAYSKADEDNLSQAQLKQLRKLVKTEFNDG
jgi:RelE toxin of RelE / RelB toxin-antitoxin system